MKTVPRGDWSYIYYCIKKCLSEEFVAVDGFFSEFCFSPEAQLIIPP